VGPSPIRQVGSATCSEAQTAVGILCWTPGIVIYNDFQIGWSAMRSRAAIVNAGSLWVAFML
jgi:hypothetical protein